jgi:phytoene dehydrogenase-like protein
MSSSGTGIAASLGKVGLPAPVSELASTTWDAVLVGGGHNGLAAAAYLAQAGKSVLVLERRDQLGGACTLEKPFADERYTVSPCAYVVGLLDQRVIDELDLVRHGYKVFIADPNLWCPFEDGTHLTQWADPDRTAASMRENGFSDSDIKGMFAYEDMFDRLRRALREGARDTWIGDSPDRAEIEDLLGHDPELVNVLFDASIAEVVGRYMDDERLHTGLFGQGVIGAWAGPRDPGTASIKLMHFAGQLEGEAAVWGYVEGGMGMVSFAIAEAAREAGAVLATGLPVAEIRPGEGVVLEGGELIRARTVISNADPRRTLGLIPDGVPKEFRSRIDGWRMTSPVMKVNCGLNRLPRFSSVPDADWPCGSMVSITTGIDDAQAGFEACTRGVPSPGFAELYFQTAYDASVAPPGKHTMSVFAQYAPYELDHGTWDSRRDEIGTKVLDAIARFAPDVKDCVDFMEVLGPPDIEERIGLTGGHIFQGECMPDQMWQGRLTPRTPIDGVYLCGAATHPAGSVIALNGRNAAMAVIADLEA